MDTTQIAKQMISFSKTSFDNKFTETSTLYNQTEKIINKFWEESPIFPEEGKKAISEWIKSYNKGCEDFKCVMNEKFKNVEDFFNESKSPH
jgi:hypothetical protein